MVASEETLEYCNQVDFIVECSRGGTRMLKLSEAISLGSMMSPQAFGVAYSMIGSCALGAAFDAIGLHREYADPEFDITPIDPWTWTDDVVVACPCCDKQDDVSAIIAHLNDNHCWTRQEIAGWIATIEAQQEANTTVDATPEVMQCGALCCEQ